MPITLEITQFENWANGFKSGEWMAQAINEAIAVIDNALQVPEDTGQMQAAFANRVPASGTGLNQSGGLGNIEMVGDPFQPAPLDTISAFMRWYREELSNA